MAERHTIVLVHGTNATSDAWTRTIAMVDQRLDSYSREQVQYLTFPWSGANSHEARLQAADDLTRWLMENTLDESNSVTLIGHSHGGNVCLYATARADIARRVARIVTLGTPFITVRRRDIRSGWGDLMISMTLYLFLISCIALFYAATAIDWPGLSPLEVGACVVVFIAIVAAGARFVYWLGMDADFLLDRVCEKQDAAFRLLAHQEKNIPLHAFRVPIDEAGVHLRSLQFISELPASVFSCLLAIRQSFLAWGVRLMQRGIVAVIVLPSQLIFHSVLSAILYLPIGAVFIVLVVVPKVVRGHRLGFGEQGLLQNVLLDIGSSSSPPSGWPASLDEVQPGESFLRHSTFFTDRKIADFVANLHVKGFTHPTQVRLQSTQYDVSARLGSAIGTALFWLLLLMPIWGVLALLFGPLSGG